MYAELVKDPMIVAVFSALIGVALSQLGTHLYGSWTHSRKRDSILRVLRNQLQCKKQGQVLNLDRKKWGQVYV